MSTLRVEERAAGGRAIRARVPRRGHADWSPAAGRRDPVELLEEQARTRVPELVPIRYGRMLASPFAFFRGAARLMAADLAGAPRTGLRGAAVRRRAPRQLRRLRRARPPARVRHQRLRRDAARAVRVGRQAARGELRGGGARSRLRRAAAARDGRPDGGARATARRCASSPTMRTLDVWYARLDAEPASPSASARSRPQARERFERDLAKAERKDSLRALAKLTQRVDGEPRIVSDPPLIVPIDELLPDRGEHVVRTRPLLRLPPDAAADRRRLLDRFRYADIARKVVGVGSVGTRAWVVLMLGRDDERPAVPAGQGGAGVGARAVPRREPVRQPRSARRRGPAADAGGERHPARLGRARRASTASAATSTCASCGTGRARR